ncbi:MAG: sporulation protein YunB [Firmicutes bacterium]|nr:sporulation protein YunB [Bacillota bacterium]
MWERKTRFRLFTNSRGRCNGSLKGNGLRGTRIVRLLIVFLLIFGLYKAVAAVDRSVRPAVIALAKKKVETYTVKKMNDQINLKVVGTVQYPQVINVQTDRDGKVAWAQANLVEINRIIAETTIDLQKDLDQLGRQKVMIPLGEALGIPILAGRGPMIPVYFYPQGIVDVTVDDRFESAGINQTRHKIYLTVFADLQIVIPFTTETFRVKNQTPIADAIYVGQVPSVLFYDRPAVDSGGLK